MGEAIEEASQQGLKKPWVLVGHGDYLDGISIPNAYEPGIEHALIATGFVDIQAIGRVFRTYP